MDDINLADQQRRLEEHYANLSDEQLVSMWSKLDDFTDLAQHVLRAEMAKRGLVRGEQTHGDDPVEAARQALRLTAAARRRTAKAKTGDGNLSGNAGPACKASDPTACDSLPQGFDSTAYDLVSAWEVDNAAEAREVMHILETVGVKCYLGPENVERVDDYKGSYDDGVEIKVMKFQRNFVRNGLSNYLKPRPEDYFLEEDAYAVRCPRCGSLDVILAGLDPELREEPVDQVKNQWLCDHCRHQWEDGGIAKKG